MADAQQQLINAQHQRNAQRQEENLRKKLEQHGRYIESCDGSERDQLREWMEAVSAAQRWTQAGDNLVLEMIGYLSKGPLRNSISDLIERRGQAQPPQPVTWVVVREHIIEAFLDEDEPEHRRHKVDLLKQLPYQDSREYGIKYISSVQKAYTIQELAVPLVMERLVRNFIGGLRDREVRAQETQHHHGGNQPCQLRSTCQGYGRNRSQTGRAHGHCGSAPHPSTS